MHWGGGDEYGINGQFCLKYSLSEIIIKGEVQVERCELYGMKSTCIEELTLCKKGQEHLEIYRYIPTVLYFIYEYHSKMLQVNFSQEGLSYAPYLHMNLMRRRRTIFTEFEEYSAKLSYRPIIPSASSMI